MLTQAFIQQFLALGFGMSPTYIVPRQGNWFNVIDNMPEGAKVDTWCAFKIKDTRGVSNSFYSENTDINGTKWSIMTKAMVSTVEVQLVGINAEYGAQTMAHWCMRGDVEAFLAASGMALLPAGLGEYITADFKQDGANTVLSYNSSFDIAWMNEVYTQQQLLTQVNLPSGVITVTPSGLIIIVN